MDIKKVSVYILFVLSLIFSLINMFLGLIFLLSAGMIILKLIKKYDPGWARKISYLWIVLFIIEIILPTILGPTFLNLWLQNLV